MSSFNWEEFKKQGMESAIRSTIIVWLSVSAGGTVWFLIRPADVYRYIGLGAIFGFINDQMGTHINTSEVWVDLVTILYVFFFCLWMKHLLKYPKEHPKGVYLIGAWLIPVVIALLAGFSVMVMSLESIGVNQDWIVSIILFIFIYMVVVPKWDALFK